MVEGYPNNLAGWGVLTILKEAGRLLNNYIRLLHPFILTFLLPAALLQFVEVIAISRVASHRVPHQFGGSANHKSMPHLSHYHQHFDFFPNGTYLSATFGLDTHASPRPLPWVEVFLLGFAASTATWVLVSLATASISKTVEYIYADHEEDPFIIKSIFRSLPRALLRLFSTFLWFLLILILTYMVLALPFSLLILLFKDIINPDMILPFQLLVSYVVSMSWGCFFYVVPQVAVLEPETYGLASLKRSFKIVKAKFWTVIGVFLLENVVFVSLAMLQSMAMPSVRPDKLPYWTLYIVAALHALLNLLFMSFWILVVVVLYFSCKLKCETSEHYLPEFRHSGDEDSPYRPLTMSVEN